MKAAGALESGTGDQEASRRRPAGPDRLLLVLALGPFLLGLQLLLAAAGPAGYHSYLIETGSMAPALRPGDLIITHYAAAASLREGDIITFPIPSDPATLVTHRIAGFEAGSGETYLITRGDANAITDAWKIPEGAGQDRLVASAPVLGYLTTMPARLVLVLLTVGLLLRRPAPAGRARRSSAQ